MNKYYNITLLNIGRTTLYSKIKGLDINNILLEAKKRNIIQ